MPRKLRVEYGGAIYHVIQRGNNQEHVFDKDADKKAFLEDLRKHKPLMSYRIFGFVVMSNHYHLILQTQGKPLQKVMHLLNTRYGKYYNTSRGRSGHVFQGRYRAILVQDESYLLSLLKYVHYNPVRAGVCASAEGYAWSSDYFYRHNRQGLVDIDLVLDILDDNNRERALHAYRQHMDNAGNGGMDEREFESISAIGDQNFQRHIKLQEKNRGKGQDEQGPDEDPSQGAEPQGFDDNFKRRGLNELLREAVGEAEDYELIKSGSRMRSLAPHKRSYAQKAWESGYTLEEIGANIKMSAPAIFKLLRQQKWKNDVEAAPK